MAKPTIQVNCRAINGSSTADGQRPECPVKAARPAPLSEGERQAARIANAWPHSVSVGRPNRGALLNPVKLTSDHTLSSRKYKNYGTQELVDIIRAATHAVHAKHKNSPRIHVGDLSRKKGGRFRPHVSHQSGRDVDIGYYMLEGQRANRLQKVKRRNLDIPRTWTMMESFLRSGQIQYMFSHRRFIPSLYRYAKSQSHITEDELLEWFGHKKRRGLIRHLKGHDCHLHIRIYSPDSLAANDEYIRRHGEDALRAHIRSIPIRTRIRRGDTLKRIAGRAGISVDDLKRLNKMKRNPKRLYRGRRLVIGHRHPWDRQPPSYVLYQRKLAKKARKAKAKKHRLLAQKTDPGLRVAKRGAMVGGPLAQRGLASLPAQDMNRLMAAYKLVNAKVTRKPNTLLSNTSAKPAKPIFIQVIAKRAIPATPTPVKPILSQPKVKQAAPNVPIAGRLGTAIMGPNAPKDTAKTLLSLNTDKTLRRMFEGGVDNLSQALSRPLAYFLKRDQTPWKPLRRYGYSGTRQAVHPNLVARLTSKKMIPRGQTLKTIAKANSSRGELKKNVVNASGLSTSESAPSVAVVNSENKQIQSAQIAKIISPKTARAVLNYRVKRGDSLWRIARKFNISMPDLCRANQIQRDCSISGLKRNTSAILPGRVLQISAPRRRG